MAVKSHKASGLLCAWGACPCVRRTLTPTHPPQDAGTPLWGPVGPLAGNGSVALDKSPPGWAGTTGEMQALTMARRPGRSLEPPILGPGWGGGAVWKPTASGFQAEDVQTWGGGGRGHGWNVGELRRAPGAWLTGFQALLARLL